MKKTFIFIILSLILLFNCTINETTGKVSITNLTKKTFKNIKIGNTVLAYDVKPGAEVEYWIFSSSNIQGALTFEGDFDFFESTGLKSDSPSELVSQKDGTFILKPGYYYGISAYKYMDDKEIVAFTATELGEQARFDDESECIEY